MIVVDLDSFGFPAALRELDGLADVTPATFDRPLTRWAEHAAGQFRQKAYPPKRPNQRYIRTGQLGRKWTYQRIGPGHVRIVNRARNRGRPYPVYVVGDENRRLQAWMHQGRWWLGRDELERLLPELRKELRKALEP